jgi:periplasmic protein CpxP/Spy
VRQIHGRMAEIHGEIMTERVRVRNAIYDLLTDEQREQFDRRTSEGGGAPADG